MTISYHNYVIGLCEIRKVIWAWNHWKWQGRLKLVYIRVGVSLSQPLIYQGHQAMLHQTSLVMLHHTPLTSLSKAWGLLYELFHAFNRITSEYFFNMCMSYIFWHSLGWTLSYVLFIYVKRLTIIRAYIYLQAENTLLGHHEGDLGLSALFSE